MTLKTRAAAGAAALTLTVSALSGCQWLAEQTTPSFPPQTKPTSSASTETAQERQMRLDQEAAVKAYLTSNKEFDRLLMAGGASKASGVLRATTGGSWQKAMVDALEAIQERGWHTDRPSTQVVSANGGWSPTELGLTACEDTSKVKFLNKKGKEVFTDRERRYVHTLTAAKVGGKWKIVKGESKAVKSFEHEGSCAT